MRVNRRRSGELEHEVLACLQIAGRPMTAAELVAEFDGRLAYNTIATTLIRLYNKGALARTRTARSYTYTVVGPSATVHAAITARRMRRLMTTADNQQIVLARFIAVLDRDDAAVLAQLLRSRQHHASPGDAARTCSAVLDQPTEQQQAPA